MADLLVEMRVVQRAGESVGKMAGQTVDWRVDRWAIL
jgi:hypothetical protein